MTSRPSLRASSVVFAVLGLVACSSPPPVVEPPAPTPVPAGPGPVLLKASPAFGPAAGGTVLTLSGARFAEGALVKFGEVAATSVLFVDPSVLEVVAPSGVPGLVTISVSNPDLQVGTLGDAYRYVAADATTLGVTSVAPNAGPTQGGTSVVVIGTGFTEGTTVTVGGQPLGAQRLADPQSIRGVMPPGMRGPVDVVVTRLDGSSVTLAAAFTYSDIAAPGLVGLSPDRGPAAGGTVITLTGSGFAQGLIVKLGGVPSTSVAVSDARTAIARTPQHAAGIVDVRVENADGVGATLPAAFTYGSTFSVAAVYPSRGPVAGGNTIALLGQGFQPGATVTFGATASPSTLFNDPSQLVVLVPAGAVGPIDVTVTNPGGETATLTAGYLYLPAPTLAALSPPIGRESGGETLQLTGTGFQPGATVRFGTALAGSVTVASDTSATCVAPAGTGEVDVVFTNPDGQTVTLVRGYSYVGPPTLTALTPVAGPLAGGTRVTLTGTGFAPGALVTFGGIAGLNSVADGGLLIETTTPALTTAGTVTVELTNADGQRASLPAAFTFVAAPEVGAVFPGRGPTTGGIDVAVLGRSFVSGAVVRFDGVSATNVRFQSSTSLVVTLPPHAAAPVSVEVENPDGQRNVLNNAFTFGTPQPPPTVTSASPLAGPTSGGTQVVVLGADFQLGAQVLFGTSPASAVSLVNAGTLNATSPAADAGVVSITVRNPDLQAATLDGGFVYSNTAAPTLAGLTPNAGPAIGGTVVTLTGTDFRAGARARFAGRDGTGLVFVDSTQLRVTTPVAVATGAVDVTVLNDDNQSATLPASFTYAAFPAPTLTSVAPTSGSASGGTAITLVGTGFRAGAAVSLDGRPATSLTVISTTLATATTPVGTPGAVEVRFTNSDAQFGALPAGFTYQPLPAPTISSLTPNTGPTSGGTNVTVSGTNFAIGATATVGGRAVSSMGVVSPTTLIFSTPTGNPGSADVVVTNPDNQSAIRLGGFTYAGRRLFEPPPIELFQRITYSSTQQIAVADFNRDGRPDIAYANGTTTAAKARIYVNLGGGLMSDRTPLTMPPLNATGIVAGDLNGDLSPDLYIAVTGQRGMLLMGDGTGGFVDLSAIALPASSFATLRPGLGDIDGDGDLDLLVPHRTANVGGVRVYLNDGFGIFTDVTALRWPAVNAGAVRDVAFIDADKTGTLDVVLTSTSGTRLYLNNGFGTFVEEAAARFPQGLLSTSVAVGDVSGDTWPDIILATATTEILLLNDGTGRFTNDSAARLPGVVDNSMGIALGDVDGDGDLDLGVEQQDNRARLYLNNGAGFFSDSTALNLPAETPGGNRRGGDDLAFVDLDGDGDLDWIHAGGRDVVPGCCTVDPAYTYAYLNSRIGEGAAPPTVAGISPASGAVGGGTNFNLTGSNFLAGAEVFVGGTQVPNAQVVSTTLIIGTTPPGVSGPADVLVINPNTLRGKKGSAFLYSGFQGYFDDQTAQIPWALFPMFSTNTSAPNMVAGDLNGDALPDVVVGGNGQARFWINDFAVSGRLIDVTPVAMPSRAFGRAVIEDLDGDGRKDIFLPAHQGQSMLFLNTAAGFVDRTADLPQVTSTARGAVAMDLDGDTDLDLIIGSAANKTTAARQQTWLNFGVGSGRFFDITAADLYLPNFTGQVDQYAVGDVNADGLQDLVTADSVGLPLLRRPGGTFAHAYEFKMPQGLAEAPRSIALVDLDGRNGPDIFLGRQGQSRLLFNDGSGYFVDVTATNYPVETSTVHGFAFLDVDGDSDLDLLKAHFTCGAYYNCPAPSAELMLNDGTGLFAPAPASLFSMPVGEGTDVIAGDFDGDGDTDALVSTDGFAPRFLRNRNVPPPLPGPTLTSLVPVNGPAGTVVTLTGTGFTAAITVTFGGVPATGVVLNPTGTVSATVPSGASGLEDVVISVAGRSYSAPGAFNAGAAIFTDGVARLPTTNLIGRAAVAQDLNGDGRKDLVIAANGQSRVLLNQAGNVMTDVTATWMPTASLDTYGLAMLETNADNAPDLVLSSNAVAARLYERNPDGGLGFVDVTAAKMPTATMTAREVVAADFTGDGLTDLAFATQSGPRVYTNNSGVFFDLTSVYIPGTGGTGHGLLTADVNADALPDLLHGSLTPSLLVGRGPSARMIDASALKLPAPGTNFDWQYARGDVNGDTFPDIMVMRRGGTTGVLLGDGRGYHSWAGRLPSQPANTNQQGVVLGDLDLDGDLDAVMCGGAGASAFRAARFWVNDGRGNFWDATPFNTPSQPSECNGVALFDQDGDGDLDVLVLPATATPVRLFINNSL